MKYLPFFFLGLLALPVQAETVSQSGGDLMPAMQQKDISVKANAPTINLSMDRSELLRLEKNAGSIIVGNPTHASVLMDTPQLLVIVPKAPGATHFTVLDADGEVMLQRHVIVAAPQENYIRVRSSYCGEDADECVKTQSYFCENEGMCHEIAVVKEEKETSTNNNSDGSMPQNSAPQDMGTNNELQ